MPTRTEATLRSERTRFASEHVFHWQDERDSKGKTLLEKATPRLQGLPIELRSYGLSVTLATLLREGRDESKAIANCFTEWLLEKSPLRILTVSGRTASAGHKPLELLRQVVDADRETYAALQSDAMGLTEQLKLLSGAVTAALEKKGEKEDGP
jgi:hypothetical protein